MTVELPIGRMISGSKSAYYSAHRDNVIVFNANVCTKSQGKIWFGDLDVTLDEEALKKWATEIGEDLYILSEMDGRFKHETTPLLARAVAVVTPTEVRYENG